MLLHSHTHQPIKCKHAFFKYPQVMLGNDTCLQKSPRGGGFHFLAHGVFLEQTKNDVIRLFDVER